MKINFYGPKADDTALINRIDIDLYAMDGTVPKDSDYAETVRVTTNPSPVSADSDYTIVTSILDSDQFVPHSRT